MQSVYIETTIPSYLTSRRSMQQAIADDQLATVQWWNTERKHDRLLRLSRASLSDHLHA
jgi:hypothetical protein